VGATITETVLCKLSHWIHIRTALSKSGSMAAIFRCCHRVSAAKRGRPSVNKWCLVLVTAGLQIC
jgi:hypothetical protein